MKDPQNLTTEVQPSGRRSPRPAPRAELHVIVPPELRATIPVGAARLVLGRKPDEEGAPALVHKGVSRKHLAVEWDRERETHTGVDLGSANGSTIDGFPANVPYPLRDGSVIRLGPVVMVYETSTDEGRGQGRDEARGDGAHVSADAIPGLATATRALRASVAEIARDPSPVLLVGETGTGKEFVAAEIHRLSGRSGKLVAVNCAALSRELVESQLYGHVKGAFTGALDDRQGLFRAAEGGTLLLDEIGELPLDLQPKLLRAIQEREIQPVGSTRSMSVDVRVIGATNRDLGREVEAGTFRRDLYARLSLWELRIPSLGRRRADVVTWIEKLHRAWLHERGRDTEPALVLDATATEAILLRPWPDNLRGLDRLVHSLAARQTAEAGTVGYEALPPWLWQEPATSPVPGAAKAIVPAPKREKGTVPTKEDLTAVLARNKGSIRATAKHYGRDRRQIYRWMEAYGLRGED